MTQLLNELPQCNPFYLNMRDEGRKEVKYIMPKSQNLKHLATSIKHLLYIMFRNKYIQFKVIRRTHACMCMRWDIKRLKIKPPLPEIFRLYLFLMPQF
jgi:hypothetical protein